MKLFKHGGVKKRTENNNNRFNKKNATATIIVPAAAAAATRAVKFANPSHRGTSKGFRSCGLHVGPQEPLPLFFGGVPLAKVGIEPSALTEVVRDIVPVVRGVPWFTGSIDRGLPLVGCRIVVTCISLVDLFSGVGTLLLRGHGALHGSWEESFLERCYDVIFLTNSCVWKSVPPSSPARVVVGVLEVD